MFKRANIVCLLLCVCTLAACQIDITTKDSNNNENEPIKKVVANAGDTEEQEATNNVNEEENAPVEEVNEQETSNEDAHSILKQSFEAMEDLTSIHMNARLNIDEMIDGEHIVEEKNMDMTMMLMEPYQKHFSLEITSNMAEPIVSDVYELDEAHYIHSSVHDVEWGVIPNPMGGQVLSPFIQDAQIEAHLLYSDQFDVSENEEEYLLTFTGAYDEIKASMYGGIKEMLQTLENELPLEMEEITSSYVMAIDKETYYVNRYETNYEAQVPEDQGEYSVVIDQTFILDEFSEHDEIVVPQEIIDKAVTMMDNDGNPTMGN